MTGSVKAYNELVGPLLSKDDREKFEWAIGAVLTGGPNNIVVLYGAAASGKSTLLRIVRHILTRFEGEFSPRVTFKEGVFVRESDLEAIDSFVFVEDNRRMDIPGALVIHTTGERIPVNKYYVLAAETEAELDAIAEVCINRYRSMGEGYYR